jgi:L-amino acid N-acyltransferase YncA
MRKLIRYQTKKGTQQLVGYVLATNAAMLNLGRSLGFVSEPSDQSDVLKISLTLN